MASSRSVLSTGNGVATASGHRLPERQVNNASQASDLKLWLEDALQRTAMLVVAGYRADFDREVRSGQH